MKCDKKCNDGTTTFCNGACTNVGSGPTTTISCSAGCDSGKWAQDCSKTCNAAMCKSSCVFLTGVCDSCKDGTFGVATNCVGTCNTNCAVSPGCEDNGNCKAPTPGNPPTCKNNMWGAKCDKQCDDTTTKRCSAGCTNQKTETPDVFYGECTGGTC